MRPGGRAASTWSWFALGLALVAATLLRVPLILNADRHLDSDLAVDGLTLLDALNGRWRWHYPGTPHVGTASLLPLLAVSLVGGATPTSLAIGGVALYLAVVGSTFLFTLRVFGPRAATWSLVPLAFASTGVVWLSGRVTGGHLLAVAWHAGAFTLLYETLSRGGIARGAALGAWCGLGVWGDSLGLLTLIGVAPVGVVAWAWSGRSSAGYRVALAFAIGLILGLTPRWIGDRVDPYDAYRETFTPTWRNDVLRGHAEILALDCLPRLFAGHRLPGLEAEPGGIGPDGRALPGRGEASPAAVAFVGLSLGLAAVGLASLLFDSEPDDPGRARWAVRAGLLVASAGVLAGFVLNRNIFNSDNYRYLVLLLVPAAAGTGRLLAGLSRRGQGGAFAAGLLGVAFAITSTIDLAAWYRGLGWLDDRWRPVARPLDDTVVAWLGRRPAVDSLLGDYWDVYRIAFLTGGRVKGVPSGQYPDRFPEWSASLLGGRPGHAIVRRTAIGESIRARVVADGGKVVLNVPGGTVWTWPGGSGLVGHD